MDFEHWKILKTEFFEHYDEHVAEFQQVAEWCNNGAMYYISDEGDYFHVEPVAPAEVEND